MMMTGLFLLAIIYFSISSASMVSRASRGAFVDAVHSSYSDDDAVHTHSHSHGGGGVHTHNHPSAAHHG
jgi:hypothetical protein